jgi:competence protein ComEC
MRVEEIDAGREVEKARGDLLLYVPRDTAANSAMGSLGVGANIQVYGRIERPKGPRNPGDFDFRHYLLLNNISAIMYLKSVTDLSVVSSHSPGWSLQTTVAAVRSGTALAIDRHVGGVEGSFLKGLLLGDRSDIPTELKSSFINAGVIHILAVSGSNVGMVALIFVSVFSLLRVRRTVTTLLTVGSLLFYMLLTGSAASVVRATIMATIILLAPVFQRKSDVFNSLAFSALLIFFVDAKQLFDPGFQLSFAAVASILYFYPKIAAL